MTSPSASPPEDLRALGARLSAVITAERISQADFAARIGASPSFVSDAARGLKVPGAQFLHAVKREFGVSLDWLIAGEGSMRGTSAINLDLFRVVCGLVELVRLWRVEGDKAAGRVAQALVDGSLSISLLPAAARQRLDACIQATDSHALAASLYMASGDKVDWESSVRQVIRSATAHFDLSRPVLAQPLPAPPQGAKRADEPMGGSGIQVNRGKVVKAAFHSFVEADGAPRGVPASKRRKR